MGKLIPVAKLLQMTYTLVEGLAEEWKKALGEIEDTFTTIVWGNSYNGKTSFVMQLLKAISHLGTILYVGYEEGHGKSFKDAVIRYGLENCSLQILDHETYPDLVKRLKKKKSPKIVVVDSLQYSRFTYEQYQELKRLFVFGKTPGKRKIIIFISHASGKLPKGSAAADIMYDVNIKIRVEGFIAFIGSRFNNEMNFCIYEKKARAHWGKDFNKMLYGHSKAPRKATPKKKEPSETTAE